jgi:hypothetical protein
MHPRAKELSDLVKGKYGWPVAGRVDERVIQNITQSLRVHLVRNPGKIQAYS